MATIRLPSDFSEFLKLLNSSSAEYLLIGGYAVNYYGSSRSTGDMDVWTPHQPENAIKVTSVLRGFGFSTATPEMLSEPDRIMEFEECYARRDLADREELQ